MTLEDLKAKREEIASKMNGSSQDFVNEWAASDSAYLCDAFAEFADGCCPIYYTDQRKYFNEHVEECERALLDLYDSETLTNLIKRDGLDGLICHAGVCGCYEETLQELNEDEREIIICLALDFCINTVTLLNIEEIESISNIDRLDDICDQIMEMAKNELGE